MSKDAKIINYFNCLRSDRFLIKSIKMALLTSFFGTLTSLQAQARGAATVLDASCAQTQDPMELASRISSEALLHFNECIDTNRFRSAAEVRFDNDNQVISLLNYRSQGGFYSAQIPMDPQALDQVYFMIKRFDVGSVKAAHTQLRFKFKSGHKVNLIHQLTGDPVQTEDLAVSFEAARPINVPYREIGRAHV